MKKIDSEEEIILKEIVKKTFVDLLQKDTDLNRKILTVIGFNSVPKDVITKEYIEKEFFSLDTEEGLNKINKLLQGAKRSLERGRYYFEERPNKFPQRINDIFERGFNSLQDVFDLISFVYFNEKKSIIDILDYDKKGIYSNEGEKEAVCRILKRAVVNNGVESSIESIPEFLKFIFGKNGMFANINTDIVLMSEERINDSSDIFNMKSVGEKIKEGSFIFGNQNYPGQNLFFDTNIECVLINLKDTGKLIDKVERKKDAKNDDVVRMKFRSKKSSDSLDKVSSMLNLMSRMELLAKESAAFMSKEFGANIDVLVESREINYLSNEEKEKYFPNEVEGENNHYSGVLQNMILKKENSLKKSADSFRNMSQKIYYINLDTKQSVGSFEMQFLTTEEDEKNESVNQAGGHFMMEIRNFSNLIFNSGKKNRTSTLKSIKRWISWYQSKFIDTQEIKDFPDSLYGEFNETLGWKSESFGKFPKGGYEKGEKNGVRKIYFKSFRQSSIDDKAEMILQFLHAEGKIVKVPIDFPQDILTYRKSKKKTLEMSKYFCSSEYVKRMEYLREEIKKKKKY